MSCVGFVLVIVLLFSAELTVGILYLFRLPAMCYVGISCSYSGISKCRISNFMCKLFENLITRINDYYYNQNCLGHMKPCIK